MKTNTLDKKIFKNFYNSTIFSKIYRENQWGGKKGEFYSGTGSHNVFVKDYIRVVANFIEDNDIHSIVEIGCGDFNVSGGILSLLDEANYAYDYVGYDVVKELIIRNKSLFEVPSRISFICKDSCIGKIKSGDLLIVRQVLQHLNNKSIKQVVEKFRNYKYIIFTEHQASGNYGDVIVPNIDQETGASIRLANKSGVYLDKAPFNCSIEKLLFSIHEPTFGLDAYINTFLIKMP